VAEGPGTRVASTTTCTFGAAGWVAMVLVDEGFRRRGIARALMEHALAFLDARGVCTVRLDATPLGQPLYEALGFVPQFRLARFEGVLPTNPPPVGGVESPPPEAWEALATLDEEVTSTDRRRLLFRLFGEVR